MKDYLRRHIWILSKLYENPKGLTYKEFEYEWGRTELNSLKTPLPKRTFADCLRAIEDAFDIQISSDARNGYRYRIVNREWLVKDNVKDYSQIDFEVMAQALLLSRAKPEDLRELMPYIVSIHGKFYNMSEIPGRPGQYQDISMDYEGPIRFLKEIGYEGYINSEYEGQRRFQDRTEEYLISEVDQVRKHQEMLKRLLDD